MRKGMTCSPSENALATSRRTWPETFAFSENTSTNTRQAVMPRMICLGPIRSEFDVPRSHPTGDVGRLKMVANSACYLFVLTRMTNKDLRRHASPVRKAVLLDVSTGNTLHKLYGIRSPPHSPQRYVTRTMQ